MVGLIEDLYTQYNVNSLLPHSAPAANSIRHMLDNEPTLSFLGQNNSNGVPRLRIASLQS
jgi:hypothetical protein